MTTVKMETGSGKLIARLQDIVRMYYPDCLLLASEDPGRADVTISITEERGSDSLRIRVEVNEDGSKTTGEESYLLAGSEREKDKEARRLARIFVYRVLARHRGEKVSPYGILTGIRPTKLVHRWLDEGRESLDIEQKLAEDYDISPQKAGLLTAIAVRERPYLLEPEEARRLISLYLGIPYCPSRCRYCTFPGGVLHSYSRQIPPFLAALEEELENLGRVLEEMGLRVQCIYIGGGTPTVLGEDDLARLFSRLHRYYISGETVEVTVEAGRPDTLSPSKLKSLLDMGVTRISINPQTMNDPTLKLIDRKHSAGEVVRSVQQAREVGFRQINMDVIVGLPREGLAENLNTAERILALRPENVTVHTLALKRGSELAESESRANPRERVQEVEKGVELFRRSFTEAGYLPYYLYRQKYMLANLENLGYSLPGHVCIYNIQMIEERQTILGLGSGAASKFVNPRDWSLRSFYNPKDPASYINAIPRLIRHKVDNLRALT